MARLTLQPVRVNTGFEEEGVLTQSHYVRYCSYYSNLELVPNDILGDIQKAHIVITN